VCVCVEKNINEGNREGGMNLPIGDADNDSKMNTYRINRGYYKMGRSKDHNSSRIAGDIKSVNEVFSV
jgi:hypothetical protein